MQTHTETHFKLYKCYLPPEDEPQLLSSSATVQSFHSTNELNLHPAESELLLTNNYQHLDGRQKDGK